MLQVSPLEKELPAVEKIEVARSEKSMNYTLVPYMTARSYILGDADSGEVYFSKSETEVVAMASLTKIMTAVVALEKYSLDDKVWISPKASAAPGSKVYLYAEDVLSVRELLYGLLIKSGNDAAEALAEHAPGGRDEFVSWMNEKALTLGMTQTHFENPTGLDAPLHYSTAQDLFLLSRYAVYTHALLRDIVWRTEYTVRSENGFSYTVYSTNQLLGSIVPVVGLKTGTTEKAGESYIGLMREEDGRETLIILLNSRSRFQEAKAMLWWFLNGGLV